MARRNADQQHSSKVRRLAACCGKEEDARGVHERDREQRPEVPETIRQRPDRQARKPGKGRSVDRRESSFLAESGEVARSPVKVAAGSPQRGCPC